MEKRKEKSVELKKHVSTIHCSNTLSLLQRKIANALLYHAYDDLLKREEHQISVRILCALIGYESHDYKTIKRALVDLLSTVIEWNIIADDASSAQEQWNASSIIADASIKGTICTYSYSNKMKQLLYTPAIYGRLNMAIQAKFKSSYGLALYENAVRYQNLRQTPWFDMPIFRKLMGVEAGKYLIFRDFKRRVLDKAIAEVNAYSSMVLTAHFKKDKRNVIAIRFDIRAQSDALDETISFLEPEYPYSNPLLQKLQMEFGLTQQQCRHIVDQYPQDFIEEKIALVMSSASYQQGKITNLAKYFLTALEQNFQRPKITAPKAKQTMSGGFTQAQDSREERRIKKAYDCYLTNAYNDALAVVTTAERTEIDKKFATYLAQKDAGFIKALYHEQGFKSKFVEIEFRLFLQQYYPEVMPIVQTIDTFRMEYILADE